MNGSVPLLPLSNLMAWTETTSLHTPGLCKGKGTVIPLQAWCGPDGA